jgi:predicted Zn-dependent protease
VTDERPPTPAGADPPPPQPTPAVRWSGPEGGSSFDGGVVLTIIGGVLLAVAALVIVVAFRSGSVATHPPARELPQPIRDAVVLVPLGEFPVDRANEIAAKEAADYGLPITVASPLAIPATAFDSGRGQLTSERLAESIAGAHPEGYGRILVIGLTTQDIYLAGRPDWRFAFGGRNQSGVAVVSSARMGRFLDFDGEWNRLTKMVTRDIGFLYYGLQTTSDPGDILYDNILSLDDLVRIGDHL